MNRPSLLANIDQVLKHVRREAPGAKVGQGNLFGVDDVDPIRYIEMPDWNEATKLHHERRVLGTFVSGHPVDLCRAKWEGKITHRCNQYAEMMETMGRIVVAGLVSNVVNRNRINFLELSDGMGRLEIMLFSDEWERYQFCLRSDMVVAAKLQPRHNGARASLQLLRAAPLMDYSAEIIRK